MLVLSRKSSESVVVGGSAAFARIVRVTVIEISSKRVRLGFDVDSDVPVHRSEVWERIHSRDKPASPRGPPERWGDDAMFANSK